MIKALGATDDETPVYVLGLSDENILRLRSHKPIRVKLEEMGGPPGSGEVMICWGKTDSDLVEYVAPTMGPDTTLTLEAVVVPGAH